MSDPIGAFCDISEAIEHATYLKWPEVARLRLLPRKGYTHFPGSLYSFVTRRVSNAADEARNHAVASGKVGYETADTLVSALLTACQSVIALHIENGRLWQCLRVRFSVRALDPKAPPDDAPLQDHRAHLARGERHVRRYGDLKLAIRSARYPLQKLSETLAACRERAAGEGAQVGRAPDITAEPTAAPTASPPGAFDDLLVAADRVKLKSKMAKVVKALVSRGGRVPLADLALECEWATNASEDPTGYVGAWNSLRIRLNKKLEKHGWVVRQHDLCAVVERLETSARKTDEKSVV